MSDYTFLLCICSYISGWLGHICHSTSFR
uniref:Uncharacterized protein n=1 Tax=Anguilla anguilla TaxID=7936 RepID=A0A0E9Y1W8_ANGAN